VSFDEANTMNMLDAAEAGRLLHLNVKRVQALARAGKLPAVRVGKKWLFPNDRLQALLGGPAPRAASGSIAISARNRLRGRVTEIRIEGLMAEVHLAIGDQELVSVITRSSVERLGLAVGDEAFGIVKSTEVMIGKEGPEA
jgi:molybdopterin-binding protein